MLVSIEEFRRYLGGHTPTPGLEVEMVSILMGVQQHLETFLNRPVELVQVREVAFSDARGNLYFTITPVRKILSLDRSYDEPVGLPVTSPYVMEPDPLIGDDGRMIDKVYDGSRENFRPWGVWVPYFGTSYAIEYVAGLDSKDLEHIKLAIKRVAAREYTTNHVYTAGQRIGHSEATDGGDSRNVGWTIGELNALQRYRRRIVK